MTIPNFNQRGVLEKGIHQCNSQQFMNRFCYETSAVRSKYKKVLEEIFAFALSREGSSIILAGSFVTEKEEPNDLDCMIILPNKECCWVQSNELMVVEDCQLDVIIIEESSKESIYSFLNLFSKDKLNLDVGMVEVILDKKADSSTWNDYEEYFSVESLLRAREAYIHRHVIRGIREKKILVTITNVMEHMNFNNKISPIVSSADWIFAPYWYYSGDKDFSLLEEVKRISEWLSDIYRIYEANISIFADGLGTLILGKYMKDSQYREFEIDRIILSRSVLNRDYEWSTVIGDWAVNMVCNLRSKDRDFIISEPISKQTKNELLYGNAYKEGFRIKHSSLIEHTFQYFGPINWQQFNNIIFPMYQTAYLLKKNTDSMIRNNIHEIAELMRNETPSNYDIFRGKFD
ncbi:hypothetical protein CDO73_23835 [Saccharibacillus sp. O23]|uniref:DUF6932 family protein n=1 Tax=Saccharibacillus sp. O23 TaxID=2009338 RepID=UPI000B4E061E|nr:hypothetical protein [Saccharibacillus sp. O23]OWR27275.1 hypothetical protein CDO73_23835 [Saccharibacillus sp. O23]